MFHVSRNGAMEEKTRRREREAGSCLVLGPWGWGVLVLLQTPEDWRWGCVTSNVSKAKNLCVKVDSDSWQR